MKIEHRKEFLREWGYIGKVDNNFFCNGWFFEQLIKVGRQAKKHQRLCEDGCNLPNFDFKLIDKKEQHIKDFIDGLNMWFNQHYQIKPLSVEFQQDPRGLTTKIIFKNKEDEAGHTLYFSLGLKGY